MSFDALGDFRPRPVERVGPKLSLMTLPLRIASIAFSVAIVVAVASGLSLIWSPARTSSDVLPQILGSSLVVLLAASLYIAVCDALARIKTSRRSSSTSDHQ